MSNYRLIDMADITPTPRRSAARQAGSSPPRNSKGAPPPVEATQRRARSRFRRWLRVVGVLLISIVLLVFLGGEAYLRWAIGLGDPPITNTDPRMYYCCAPSQTCMRMHHLIHYNRYSMRSDDFPPHKTDPAELRIVMIGDSVINGGSRTDQSELVSELLKTSLSDDLHRPVVVGNASAGGWGPPSELGWLRTYGTLDADIVVLVVSSHDYADVPRWPLEVGWANDRPTHKPLLAWEEFLMRYSWRMSFTTPAEPVVDTTLAKQSDINWCFWSIGQIVQISHAQGALVIVAQHAERNELGGKWKPGHAYNQAAARSAGADRIIQFEPAFRIASETGNDPYRPFDFIHPNKAGHRLMAEELRHEIEKLLEQHSGSAHAGQ